MSEVYEGLLRALQEVVEISEGRKEPARVHLIEVDDPAVPAIRSGTVNHGPPANTTTTFAY